MPAAPLSNSATPPTRTASGVRPPEPKTMTWRAVLMLTTTLAAAGAVRAAAAAPAEAAGNAFTLVTFAPSPFEPADLVVTSTQACVEAISKADLSRARVACREAVNAAHAMRLRSLEVTFSDAGNRNDLAITYSNRAVMHVLAGEIEAARRDIARASALMPHDPAIEATRARIEASAARTNGVAAAGESLEGKAVEWMEQVTDAQYLVGPPAEVKR